MKKSDDEVRAALVASVREFASEAPDAEAEELLAGICKSWGLKDLNKLDALLRRLAVGRLSTDSVLFWLYVTLLLEQLPNGCEVIFLAGLRVAARCGVTAELVEKLRLYVAPVD